MSKNQTLMVMADADNMRKRLIQERENERIYAI
jgi:molecular chaperone GrpE (heat shock protein)